jgi:hypothetical protein
LKLPRLLAVTLIVLGTSLFSLPTANAASTGPATITCGKEDGTQRTANVGWDNSQTFFQGKGDIARLYCEGGYSGGFPIFVSTSVPDGPLRYYNGVAPTPEPTPEPEPTPSPTPSPSEEPTPEPVQPQPEPSPSPSETSTATVTPEPVVPVPSPEPTNTVPLPEPSPTPVPAPEPAPEPVPEPLPIQPAPVPEPPVVIQNPEPSPEPEPEPEITPEPVPVEETPVPEPEPEVVPIEEEQPEPAPEFEPEEEVPAPVVPELVPELPSEPPVVEEETIQADDIDLATLPPDTPVELSNGVVVTAQVAIAIELLGNPAELLATIFTDPTAALAALGSVGADLPPEVRERAEEVVISAIIVGNIATSAAVTAAAGATYRRKP